MRTKTLLWIALGVVAVQYIYINRRRYIQQLPAPAPYLPGVYSTIGYIGPANTGPPSIWAGPQGDLQAPSGVFY